MRGIRNFILSSRGTWITGVIAFLLYLWWSNSRLYIMYYLYWVFALIFYYKFGLVLFPKLLSIKFKRKKS